MRKLWVVGMVVTIIMTLTIGTCLLVFGPSEYINPPPNRGDFESEVFDGDLGPGENYINENLEIRFWPTSNIRHVGDSTTGLSVDVSNLARNWGPFTADVKGQENYEQLHIIEESGYWTVSAVENTYVRWRLFVPVTSGVLTGHSVACLYLWSDNDDNETNGYGTGHKPQSTIWDNGDEIKFEMWSGGNKMSMDENEKTIYGENRIQ